MKRFTTFLQAIPGVLSSTASICIYLFLFLYLVIFALLCAVIPALAPYAPSDTMQLIMGNYTNVLSALAASIAAGSGVAAHHSIRSMHTKHDEMMKKLDAMQAQIQQLKQDA